MERTLAMAILVGMTGLLSISIVPTVADSYGVVAMHVEYVPR